MRKFLDNPGDREAAGNLECLYLSFLTRYPAQDTISRNALSRLIDEFAGKYPGENCNFRS